MHIIYTPRPLQYEKVEEGKDNNRLTKPTFYTIFDLPKKFYSKIPTGTFKFRIEGYDTDAVICHWITGGKHIMTISPPEGYYFGVSMSPDWVKAMSGACVHDLLYEIKKALAVRWGVRESFVRKFADYVFKTVLTYDEFRLKYTYFKMVRWFGGLFSWLSPDSIVTIVRKMRGIVKKTTRHPR